MAEMLAHSDLPVKIQTTKSSQTESQGPNDPANIIRNLVVAQPGHVLYARDFSGIEAVLTGYFALDPRYIRLAKRDVHTYYTVYALYELEGGARIKAADLPDLDWPDDRLFPHLEL
jgi:hypothetical protein